MVSSPFLVMCLAGPALAFVSVRDEGKAAGADEETKPSGWFGGVFSRPTGGRAKEAEYRSNAVRIGIDAIAREWVDLLDSVPTDPGTATYCLASFVMAFVDYLDKPCDSRDIFDCEEGKSNRETLRKHLQPLMRRTRHNVDLSTQLQLTWQHQHLGNRDSDIQMLEQYVKAANKDTEDSRSAKVILNHIYTQLSLSVTHLRTQIEPKGKVMNEQEACKKIGSNGSAAFNQHLQFVNEVLMQWFCDKLGGIYKQNERICETS